MSLKLKIWRAIFVASTLAVSGVGTVATAQDGVPRPHNQTERPGNRPSDHARNRKAMEEANALLARAHQWVSKALPVYSGHGHRAKYLTQFAAEDMTRALQYSRPDVSGARPNQNFRSDLRQRIENIPAVRDKSQRDYPRDTVRVSDSQLNSAGLLLLQARNKVSRIRDDFGGHLSDSRRSMDMAISEIERAIGRIRGNLNEKDLNRNRRNREIDGIG